MKAALAATAGYFAGAALATVTNSVILINAGALLVGLAVGLGLGLGLGFIQRRDFEQFAENMVAIYKHSNNALKDPQAYARYGLQKAEDLAYCSIATAGGVLVETAEQAVRERVNGFVRRLSPLHVR